MDQADLGNIPSRAASEGRLIMSDAQQYRCHLITRALAGLANLSAPEEIDACRTEANVIREDLGAIFELLAANLQEATTNLPVLAIDRLGSELFASEKRRRR